MSTVYEHATQYEDRVAPGVQAHVKSLMARWRDEGRDDAEIESIVRTVVLNAYVTGRRHGRSDASAALDGLPDV